MRFKLQHYCWKGDINNKAASSFYYLEKYNIESPTDTPGKASKSIFDGKDVITSTLVTHFHFPYLGI